MFHGRAEMEAHKRIVVEKELIKVKKLYGDLLQLKEEISFCPLFDDYERLEQLHGELKEENKIRYGLKDYVAKPPERKYKIVAAKYVLYSNFTIPDDRNIEDAHWMQKLIFAPVTLSQMRKAECPGTSIAVPFL